MEQKGKKKNKNQDMTKTCPVKVRTVYDFVVANGGAPSAGGSDGGASLPVTEMGIGLVAALALLQLRRRSSARARA